MIKFLTGMAGAMLMRDAGIENTAGEEPGYDGDAIADDEASIKAVPLPPGITQELYNKAVEANGKDKVKFADLPLDDEGSEFLTVLVRVPNRKAIGEYQKWEDSNPTKAQEILINATLLSHRDQVKANDGLFYAAFSAAAQLMPIRKAIIKN